MTDTEIKQYLLDNNGVVCAQDCIMNVFNTSPQIIAKNYNYETNMMTFITYVKNTRDFSHGMN